MDYEKAAALARARRMRRPRAAIHPLNPSALPFPALNLTR
jgi:hypothetical protein